MEKKRATYDLKSFVDSTFDIRTSALKGASKLGYSSTDIRRIVKQMNSTHFYKSMTSDNDHQMWQDVYYFPYEAETLYIKFCSDELSEFALLSFKENTSDRFTK